MSSTKQPIKIKVSDGITIVGKRGSGKTTLMKYLMTKLPHINFEVFDLLGNFEDYRGKGNIVNYHVISLGNQEDINTGETIPDLIDGVLDRGDTMVVIDEADRYPYKQKTGFSNMIDIGRNFNVGYIAATRRPANISKDFLANSTYIFAFRTILPQDLEVMTDWLAIDGGTLKTLGKFEFIAFYEGDPIYKGKVLVPKKSGVSGDKKKEEDAAILWFPIR
jgi:DNA helicase HerA-like ATPase